MIRKIKRLDPKAYTQLRPYLDSGKVVIISKPEDEPVEIDYSKYLLKESVFKNFDDYLKSNNMVEVIDKPTEDIKVADGPKEDIKVAAKPIENKTTEKKK